MPHRMESNHWGTITGNNISGCRIATNDWSIESALLDGTHRYYKPTDVSSVCNGNLKV